jgi:tetratricopeptide (TPR) repeat protein
VFPATVPWISRFLVVPWLVAASSQGLAAADDPGAPLERAIAAAESRLREGEPQAAESLYRGALFEGWLLLGTLAVLDDEMVEAREAFRSASSSVVDDRRALHSLALVHLRAGDAEEAVAVLTRLARRDPADVPVRRLLAQALVAKGAPEQAVRELLDARAKAPRDLELAFALASAYLGLQKADEAARLFAEIVKERPIPQTHVLIGRTYRDFGEHARARAALQEALKLDARVRRAHYYLGMVAVKEHGRAGIEEAIREFQAELLSAPQDPLANLELGVALVEHKRPADALPALEIAARADPRSARTLAYLGRAQLGADRPAEAKASLERALALAQARGANRAALLAIHLQLGQALKRAGFAAEAETHFAESQRLSAQGTDAEREEMSRYLADVSAPEAATTPVLPLVETSGLAAIPAPQRQELRQRVKAALARTYFNLGVVQAQAERSGRAAELLEQAAVLAPEFPQVQSSLGVAYFNSRQFDKAAASLTRALAASPGDAGITRMLAMAWLNTEAYDKAAELLRDDPERAANPSLQFAYGLSLVRSNRAAEGEAIFASLLAQHGDSAELSVMLGQAHAQQGDFPAAIESLQRALRLKSDVAEANANLGVIYLRQGKLPEAEAALRAELLAHPGDLQAQQNLAIVLETVQRPEEAVLVLRGLLKARPEHAAARYLLGKILLAQGAATEAVDHLEAAVRLAPEDPASHYQLGQAYQKLGRTDQAQQQFERFRELKDKTR